MECHSQVVVRSEGSYLLEVTGSRRLQLPSCKLQEEDTFLSAAEKCLSNVVGLDCRVSEIVSIRQSSNCKPGRLVVTFLTCGVDQVSPDPLNQRVQWLHVSKLVEGGLVDEATVKLLEAVEEGGRPSCPLSILETAEERGGGGGGGGEGKGEGEGGEGGKEVRRKGNKKARQPSTLTREPSMEEQMLEQTGYGPKVLEQIDREFVERCGSIDGQMNEATFTSLMVHLGLPEHHCGQCYRALATSPHGLSLKDLQVGLCALDPHTPHGEIAAQIRCQIIFQFYNTSESGRLGFSEFKVMVKDINELKKRSLSSEQLEEDAREKWKVFGISEEEGITLASFLMNVGQLKFRGTSLLLRLPHSPVKHLWEGEGEGGGEGLGAQHARGAAGKRKVRLEVGGERGGGGGGGGDEDEEPMEVMDQTLGVSDPNVEEGTSTDEVMASVDNSGFPLDINGYSIATHFVKVRRTGTLSDVNTLWDLVGTDAVSGSVDSILNQPAFNRLPSIRAFDRNSKSNEMLNGLRYFEHALKNDGRGHEKEAFSWGAVEKSSVARCFVDLCARVGNIFSSEPRLLEVSSPVYVLGDLHGNFHDLVCFEKVLWRMGPVLTPASFLFLGDYVDRGEHGFEVVAYLFAQKLLMPSKFLLIRGNHEIRAVQELFSYKSECIRKFGSSQGMEVWEATNKAFDTMPLAACIDKKVLCVHGGIPATSLCSGLITTLNRIPTHLPDPYEQSQLAWDVMWNDPIRVEDIDDSTQKELDSNKGFVENFSRGTAHMFNAEALERFLKANKLSHVIRAHEMKASGFQIQQHGRLLTVFSSSHYCGAANEAACVLVDNRKIRTIRLDTT